MPHARAQKGVRQRVWKSRVHALNRGAFAVCDGSRRGHACPRAAAAAVAHERDQLRVLLAKEIGWIDRRVEDMERVALSMEGAERREQEREIVAARAWRESLRRDLEILEHPPPRTDWTDLEQRIERDLDDLRPPSILRSYDEAYGI